MARLKRKRADSDGNTPDLMEELVKASLKINPQLAQGETTSRVMQRLRQDMEGAGKPGVPSAPSPVTEKKPLAGPPAEALELDIDRELDAFFETKLEAIRSRKKVLEAKREALDREESQLHEKSVEQIVRHLQRAASYEDDRIDAVRRWAEALRTSGLSPEILLARVSELSG